MCNKDNVTETHVQNKCSLHINILQYCNIQINIQTAKSLSFYKILLSIVNTKKAIFCIIVQRLCKISFWTYLKS